MQENRITLEMADFAVRDHWNEYTEREIRMAKLCCLDWVAAAATGVHEKGVEIMLDMLKSEGTKGECAVIGHSEKMPARWAALLNGTESHAIDFDDIHDYLSLHLCSPVIPAALAAAEAVNTCGRKFLNGLIVGMQIMVAISAGTMPEHYNVGRWHATGTIGIFGAAAAAGAILGLTSEQMCNAYGICAGICSGIQLNFGSMAKPMCAGEAAKNGISAVQLAAKGFTGRPNIFDTDFFDNITTRKADTDAMLERLRGPWGVHELRIKRYPCGAPTHSGIINCREILAQHPHRIEEIEKIVFEPYPSAVRLVGNMDPQTGLQGKFSIAFTAAAQIVFGGVTIETFTDENVKNPQVQYLIKRMSLEGNDEFTPWRGGRATMYFTDGTSASRSNYLLGHDVPVEEAYESANGKYDEVMYPRFGKERSDAIRAAIDALDASPDVRGFAGLLGAETVL